MVVSFKSCIARPKEGERHFPLIDHLEAVASRIGDPNGTFLERVDYLAGLMHDIGKANAAWQVYIRKVEQDPGGRYHGPPHAPAGAAVFAYLASFWLDRAVSSGVFPQAEYPSVLGRILWWIRDIYDHHRALGDLEETRPPWHGQRHALNASWMHYDWPSIHAYLAERFSELADRPLSPSTLQAWLREFDRLETWRRWTMVWLTSLRRTGSASFLTAPLRDRTARLIHADRTDAAKIPERFLTRSEIEAALEKLLQALQEKMADVHQGVSPMAQLRQKAHDRALMAYRKAPDRPGYLLKLPTGYGKTMTALRLALEMARDRVKRRIVYVAPYLSILAQAAEEIRQATGLEVLTHHGHALAEEPIVVGIQGKRGESKGEDSQKMWDEQSMLVLESWQAPVVVTTFNQLFRGLFPSRAQEAMRLAALDHAVVVIDEPQIIDLSVWRPFLAMLDAAMRTYGVVVIWITATPPPLVPGLTEPPVLLAEEAMIDVRRPNRYVVRVLETALDEEGVRHAVLNVGKGLGQEESARRVAVIMNTITDAALVYRRLKEAVQEDDWGGRLGPKPILLHLHGAMTAFHKTVRIAELKCALIRALEHGARVWAVTTQVIEAGVDVSFDVLFRALPIYSSVVQAAGRVNRHMERLHTAQTGETSEGEVIVFPFRRRGQTDTRQWVYRDPIIREETDRLLEPYHNHSAQEVDMYEGIERFFDRVMRRLPVEANLEALKAAERGQWSSVAGFSPFVEDAWSIPIFVPWDPALCVDLMTADGEAFCRDDHPVMKREAALIRSATERLRRGMEAFGVQRIDDLYERYIDKAWFFSLDFVERRRFMALLEQFTVSLSPKLAYRIAANFRDEVTIKRAADLGFYTNESGFGDLFVQDAEQEALIL